MTEYVYLTLYLVLELCSYTLGYLILFHAKLTTSVKAYLLVGMLFLILPGIAVWSGHTYLFRRIGVLLCLVIPAYFIRPRKAKWFLLFLPIYISVSVFQIVFSFALGLWSGRSEMAIVKDRTAEIFCGAAACLLLFVIWVWQHMGKKERREPDMDTSQYILFYIGTFCSFILIGCVQALIGDYGLTVKMVNALGLAIVLVCITFFLIVFRQGIIKNSELRYRHQAEQYRQFMQMQEKQIRQIIESDTAMRRYRHDMKAHMTAIQALSAESKNET